MSGAVIEMIMSGVPKCGGQKQQPIAGSKRGAKKQLQKQDRKKRQLGVPTV